MAIATAALRQTRHRPANARRVSPENGVTAADPGLLTMQVPTQNSGHFMLNSDLYHVRDVFGQDLTQGWLGATPIPGTAHTGG